MPPDRVGIEVGEELFMVTSASRKLFSVNSGMLKIDCVVENPRATHENYHECVKKSGWTALQPLFMPAQKEEHL